MATFRLSGENKKVSVVRRTVHVRNTLSVFLTEKTEGFCNGLWLSRAMCIIVYFTVCQPFNSQLSTNLPHLFYRPCSTFNRGICTETPSIRRSPTRMIQIKEKDGFAVLHGTCMVMAKPSFFRYLEGTTGIVGTLLSISWPLSSNNP